MRTYAAVALAILTLSPAIWAQACYTPITSWQGNYTLIGTSLDNTCIDNSFPDETCGTAQSATANVSLYLPIVSCSELEWPNNTGAITDASLDDTQDYQCNDKPPTQEDYEALGSTGGSGAFDQDFLYLYVSSGTYLFTPFPYANAVETWTGCHSEQQDVQFPLYPATQTPFPTLSLPTSVAPLLFDGPDFVEPGGTNANVEWTLSFALTPSYNCKDCQSGDDDGIPASSSIAARNQSLGEDVLIAGTPFHLHYESDRTVAAGGDSLAIALAAMFGGWTLNVQHAYDPTSNTLFLGDGTQRNGYELGTPVSFNGNLLITSQDGGEVYVFSPQGQHLQTLLPLTGAVEYTFGYDASFGLVNVTDGAGNVTTIQRNASEQPTAIISPYGEKTTLGVDSKGLVNEISDPLGKSETFVNNGNGLLTSRTDRNGNSFTYTYDANNRLAEDADSLGGYVTLSRTQSSSGLGWTIAQTTSMGRTSSYQTTLNLPWAQDGTQTETEQHADIGPDGLLTSWSQGLQSSQLSQAFSLPDGTSDSETLGPDPVWGPQVPVETSVTITQGNLTMNVAETRTATLGTAGDPFSLVTETDSETVNGRTYTSTFTGSTRTWVNASPAGRTTTITLDSLERIASSEVKGLEVTKYKYDSRGCLASATQGARQTKYSYNSHGFLAKVTDPLKLATSYSYDTDGNVLTTTLPDGRVINYSYDANGNLTSVTPPGESVHDFAYNAVDQPTSYTPPGVIGTGATTYAYDLDRDLTSITRPDGKKITYGYDTAGRLSSTSTPTGTTTYAYSSTTGNVVSANRGAQHLSYGYNGPLPTKSTWTGTVAGSVSRTYNDNFWVVSESVSGGGSIAFKYDNDGLPIKAGALTIKRSPNNGLVAGTTLGVTTDSLSYDTFGELTGYTASVSGTPVYSLKLTRDADGRITEKTETINGATNTYSYTYDLAGRLATATKNAATDTYTYDSNSNLLSGTTSSGTSNGTYDAQDRLLTYGTASYTYTANGELASQTSSGKKTTYTYDVLGNLIAATLPPATKLTYIIDGENHRVGKKVNGVLQAGFLYDGDHVVAQLNGSNALVSQFVYATGSNSPDYMISGGATYRIFSDQLGSPVLVVNAATGAIVEQITYDEFGNIIADTNPGFQPFGFAGGLYDQDLKLVRFGARDYYPAVGRWTVKDPILFNGGDTNLYGYVLSDPLNLTDTSGLTIYREDAAKWVRRTRRPPCRSQEPRKPQPPKPPKPNNPTPKFIPIPLAPGPVPGGGPTTA